MTEATQTPETIPQERLEAYYDLIQKLMNCPSGNEPEVLDKHLDLIDAGLITVLMRVATMMAHEDNQDGARFLIFIARQLSVELGFYPDTAAAAV
jgi:hypothetical protein